MSHHPSLTRAALLRLDGVTKRFGTRVVVNDISLALHPGHRLGVVGENGAGKSTLLRIAASIIEPDAGTVDAAGSLAYLDQATPGTGDDPRRTVADVVAEAIAPAAELLENLARAAEDIAVDARGGDSYSELLAEAEDTDAWNAEQRVHAMLDGLGLGSVVFDRPLAAMSGGQRARLALAAVLLRRPAVLVLDEPTNHLDDDAMRFLESTLRSLPGVVLFASHDRVFLDEIATATLDLDPAIGGITVRRGTYSDYLADKHAERQAWEATYLRERNEARALRTELRTTARTVAPGREMADRNKMAYGVQGDRVDSQVSRRVRSATQRLETLESSSVRKPPRPLTFAGPGELRAVPAGPLVTASRAGVTSRLPPVSVSASAGDRLLVTGPNGCGKSTLLAMLVGRLEPDQGSVWRAAGAEVSLLEQDVDMGGSVTSRDIFESLARLRRVDAIPDAVELGLLPAADRDRPVEDLSLGQRRRIALAVLMARPPDVLLLDEPSNHLSLTLVDELEDALGTVPGAVIVASHDRWLRRRWDGAELVLAG